MKVNSKQRRTVLEKLIGVSPPQTGQVADIAIAPKTSQKLDDHFEKELKSKIDLQDKREDKKEVLAKSSGGIKKKMVKKSDEDSEKEPKKKEKAEQTVLDAPVVLNFMVSSENEIKTSDLEQDLTETENQNTIQSLTYTDQLTAEDTALLTTPEIMDDATDVVVSEIPAVMPEQVVQPEQQLQPELEMQSAMMAEASRVSVEEQIVEGPAQDVVVKPEFESKVFEALSKEQPIQSLKPEVTITTVATAVDQQSTEQSFDQSTGQQSSSDSQTSNESMKSPEAPADLASQVSALHVGQGHSFSNVIRSTNAAAAPNLDSTNTDTQNSVDEVMNQAKYLVTKGGGEMTVKMSPEGMGEVHLKVILQEGKINIEMNTQDKSVKKLIEESLSDLKSSLASQQMKLDHVKINSVVATGTENNTQMNSNQNQSFSNQQGQGFQNLFNQSESHMGQNQQQRQAHSATRELNNPVVKTQVKPQFNASAYSVANKGRSINMVA